MCILLEGNNFDAPLMTNDNRLRSTLLESGSTLVIVVFLPVYWALVDEQFRNLPVWYERLLAGGISPSNIVRWSSPSTALRFLVGSREPLIEVPSISSELLSQKQSCS